MNFGIRQVLVTGSLALISLYGAILFFPYVVLKVAAKTFGVLLGEGGLREDIRRLEMAGEVSK